MARVKDANFIKECLELIKNSGILLILFFCVCISVLMPQHVYIKDVFCILSFVLCGFKMKTDRTVRWLVAFSISYALISMGKQTYGGVAEWISYIIAPFAFYQFGQYIVEKNKSESLLVTFFVLAILLLGLHAYLQTYQDFSLGSFINTRRRLDLGDDEATLTATLLGAIVS